MRHGVRCDDEWFVLVILTDKEYVGYMTYCSLAPDEVIKLRSRSHYGFSDFLIICLKVHGCIFLL